MKHQIVLYPVLTEKTDQLVLQNKIVFCVDVHADKPSIKREVEQLYEVKVEKVNTLIKPDGRKMAIVKLAEPYRAIDLQVRLGLV